MSFSGRGRTRAFVLLCIISLSSFLVGPFARGQGNGALYFSPSSAHHEVGDLFSVSVRLTTGGVAINAAEGSIVYDSAKLEVVSLSKTGSIFNLWTDEPTFSNSDGTIAFGGGLPNPGYSGANGQIITINFRAKTATTIKGYTDVVFVSGAILENDGSGTNILQSLGRATYFIGAAGITPSSTPNVPLFPGVGAVGAPPVISSTTHPDQTKWYSKADAHFTWPIPTGVQSVLLVLGTRSTSAPRVSYTPAISEKSISELEDGIWYFNARFKTSQGLGPVASFRFNVDTHAPEAFTITRADTSDPTNPQPEIVLNATDRTSGIDHYEVSVDTSAPVTVPGNQTGKSYRLVPQVPGTQQIMAKVFDAAGNTATTSFAFTVAPIPAPTITEFPQHVDRNTPLKVSGRGVAGNAIRLYAVIGSAPVPLTDPSDTNGQIGTTTVDSTGNWTMQVNTVDSGLYTVYAYAQDGRGALSMPSNTVQVRVTYGVIPAILHFLRYIVTTLWIGYLLALTLLILLGVYAMRRLRTPAVKRKREGKKLASKLDIMLRDIEDEVTLLGKMSRGRPLYPEEKYLKSKLVQYRKTIRQVLDDTHSRLAKKK